MAPKNAPRSATLGVSRTYAFEYTVVRADNGWGEPEHEEAEKDILRRFASAAAASIDGGDFKGRLSYVNYLNGPADEPFFVWSYETQNQKDSEYWFAELGLEIEFYATPTNMQETVIFEEN
jgi:hypothetical protein